MNRLYRYLDDPLVPEPPDEYFEIDCLGDTFIVSRETAVQIERWMDQLPPPRWAIFRDLAGTRHRVMTGHICRVSESTAAQRAALRAFRRARRLEDKEDRRPWEDDC